MNLRRDDLGARATPAQLDQMEASLANDEASSDEELVEFFVKECGIAEKIAREAVTHRGTFLTTAIPEKGLLAERLARDGN